MLRLGARSCNANRGASNTPHALGAKGPLVAATTIVFLTSLCNVHLLRYLHPFGCKPGYVLLSTPLSKKRNLGGLAS